MTQILIKQGAEALHRRKTYHMCVSDTFHTLLIPLDKDVMIIAIKFWKACLTCEGATKIMMSSLALLVRSYYSKEYVWMLTNRAFICIIAWNDSGLNNRGKRKSTSEREKNMPGILIALDLLSSPVFNFKRKVIRRYKMFKNRARYWRLTNHCDS